ncbi:MAG: zf-TFIIB domain-containing protein [Patescibacteria group bacterium]|nr:zf-TFIIB domain-containing protein [Patescibacteria group bacterium]
MNGTADPNLIANALHAIGRTFMGGALENRGDAPMGKGHDNAGKPFDIETARYLKPVFAAYDSAVRSRTRAEIVLLAGVKTLKSFALEICAADHICNRNGDTAIFFGSGDVADTVSTTRVMADMFGYERIQKKLRTISNVAGKARFQLTNGAIKFPDKTFFLLPANLNTLQQKNLGFAGMQDAFVTGATGVIEEMIARTTQYRDAIVFLESQGGETGFDFDRHYLNTNQGELHVICPVCGKPHIFNWKAFDEQSMTRTDGFIPTPPLSIPSLDHSAWIEHNRPLLISPECRVAGFQRGDDKLIKNENGDYIPSAILRETHFQCFHCGGIWLDDGEFGKTRIHLDKTSHYVSSNPNALLNKIGFNFAQWINRRLTFERQSGWGQMMLEKLQAQKTAKEHGNYGPIKIWWQKVAARTWDDELFRRKNQTAYLIGSYETDPAKLSYPPEIYHCRQMTVDCGKDEEAEVGEKIIGKLFFEVRDWDKTGNSKQLARGMVESVTGAYSAWDLLAAQQRYWKVPCRRVFIDAAWMPSQVMEAAAKHFELVPPDKPFQLPSTWRLMWGADGKRIGNKGQTFVEEKIPGIWRAHDRKGKLWAMSLQKIRWLNYWFEDQLVRILLQTASVKWENLPQDKLVIVDIDGNPSPELTRKYCEFERDTPNKFRSWNSGLDSRHLDIEKNKYVDTHKSGHWTEPRDVGLLQVVGVAADGLLGHVVAEDSAKNG